MLDCMLGLWERLVSPLIFLDGALINTALQQCTVACSNALGILACMAAQVLPAQHPLNTRAARNAPHFTTYACLTLLMLQHQASSGMMKIINAAHREVQYLATCCGLSGIYMTYEYDVQVFPAD